ncbi:MAG: hypothetical protein ACRC1W_01290 [Shewanella sp.]
MINPEHIEQLRTQYTRAQSQFATVIQEMEAELQRMKDNERIPEGVLSKKDWHIDTLIGFNNRIEELFAVYKLVVINYHYELIWTNEMLWKAIKSDKPAFEVFMSDVKKIRKVT